MCLGFRMLSVVHVLLVSAILKMLCTLFLQIQHLLLLIDLTQIYDQHHRIIIRSSSNYYTFN